MPLTDVPMYYVSSGQFQNFLLWIFTDYVGYGIVYVLLGLAVFATVYQKTRSAAIGGFIFALFLAVVNATLPIEIQMYFTIIIAIMFFVILYRVLR